MNGPMYDFRINLFNFLTIRYLTEDKLLLPTNCNIIEFRRILRAQNAFKVGNLSIPQVFRLFYLIILSKIGNLQRKIIG